MEITLIAALNEVFTIGINQSLPWHLPIDLKHFMNTTKNKTIIMGRKTYESIGKPLPHRNNIVISRRPIDHPEVTTFHSLDDAIEAQKEATEVFITGGQRIYQAALPIVKKMILTFVESWDEGDTFFPYFNPSHWKRQSIIQYPKDEKHAYRFNIQVLVRSEN